MLQNVDLIVFSKAHPFLSDESRCIALHHLLSTGTSEVKFFGKADLM